MVCDGFILWKKQWSIGIKLSVWRAAAGTDMSWWLLCIR
jgi:hypothetical protein